MAESPLISRGGHYRWGPLRILELVLALLELLWLLICIRFKSLSVRGSSWGIHHELAARVAQTPNAPALVSTATGEALTFRELDELSSRIAHWLIASGIRQGDVVAIVRHGCPRYIALWLGAAKAGATAALVNTQLRGGALLHAVRLALDATPRDRQLIICDREALTELGRAGVRAALPAISICVYGAGASEGASPPGGSAGSACSEAGASVQGADGVLALEDVLGAQPSRAPDLNAPRAEAVVGNQVVDAERRADGARARDVCGGGGALALIYTSGTTGLPKASRFSHLRCWMAGKAAHVLCRLGPSDRVYCALPLFHASGGMMGVSASILSGCCLLIPERFSASSFLPDCALHGATGIQYIGEMARYVVAANDAGGGGTNAGGVHAAVGGMSAGGTGGGGGVRHGGQLRIRFALGNGLQPELWRPFQAALSGSPTKPSAAAPRIVEFYASTEGNVNLFNNTGRPGAVGVVPFFAAALYPIVLARLSGRGASAAQPAPSAAHSASACAPAVAADVELAVSAHRASGGHGRASASGAECGSGGGGPSPPPPALELARHPHTGLCVPCAPGEPGQLLGLISMEDPLRAFHGYTDSAATRAKIVSNVRAVGDAWFASGDLLARDWFGFYYWVDRAGDTFRWKGENVSTAEVAAVVASAQGVADAAVFGVRLPRCEGRAGMAAVVLAAGAADAMGAALGPCGALHADGGGGHFWRELYRHCAAELPAYARPAFVRVLRAEAGGLAMTATHKHQKAGLEADGWQLDRMGGDVLLVRDDRSCTFVPLTAERARDIECGRVRL